MKPPPFRYHDPDDLAEALDLVATLDNAKLLAGGQSLMPMLNLRLAFPDDVVDLNRIESLSHVSETAAGISIGAMTRQRELERSDLLVRACPVMHEALAQVGHRQTRNRGTIGGSLCHLDPSAELPVVAAALDATIRVSRRGGSRSLPMSEFPAFYMTPAIEPDEIVTVIDFEPWPEGHGYAFVEFARRPGDFAVDRCRGAARCRWRPRRSKGIDCARRRRRGADTLRGCRGGARRSGGERRSLRRGGAHLR